MNLLYELSLPIIFAHRGASTYAPENTLSAFNLAAEQGADAIELDAKLTTDGEVVVIHDQTLERTTNGKGLVTACSLTELRALDAGSWRGAEFAGERIPLLSEVFEAVGQKMLINVELTNYLTPEDALPEKVVELVRRHGLEERVMYSSFRSKNLRRVTAIMPDAPVGLLALELFRGLMARSSWGQLSSPNIIHPYFTDASARYIAAQHRAGRRVHVWTVNDEAVMRRLFNARVDGIFTDDPLLAMHVRSEVLNAAG